MTGDADDWTQMPDGSWTRFPEQWKPKIMVNSDSLTRVYELAQYLAEQIAAARAEALAAQDAERKHLINVAYSWCGMGLEEMVSAMRTLPIGADVEQAP
jgi:hypothetical protein